MDLFSLSATLDLDRRAYESGIREAKSSFSELGSHVANVAKSIAGVWAFKEAISGIKNLTSAVVAAYGEYEQLAGGVETLFGNSADAIKAYADVAYKTAGMSANQYMATATSFAAALIQGAANSASESTRITEEAAEEQYEAVQAGLDRQLTAFKRAQEDQYNALKSSLDKRYKALQKSFDKQYKAASEAVEDEIEAYSEGLQRKQEALQEAQEKETKALQANIDKRIAAVDKEYENALKRIDEERSARLKLIDDELKALDEEAAAKEKAAKEEERATTRQRLEQAVQWATTSADRINAQNKLNDYLEKIRQEDEADERKARIDELKAQKDQINDEADAEEDAAKDQHDSSVSAIKEQGQAELEALQKNQKAQMKALQDSNSRALKQFRRAKQKELESLRESQQNQLEAVSESNAAQLESYKRAQQDALDAQKEANAKRLKELNKSLKEQQTAVTAAAVVTADAQARAAAVADMAIQDMADNANKMGTSMESIQMAYQGFSKQNYTMLDNLKLGYGGTKTEMERLLKDAGALSGQEYSIDNLMDVYEAIHVIQENMGITGTTAEEAAHTIQGSMASTKAAWDNLMVSLGSGEGVQVAMDNLFSSAVNVVNNIIPVIRRLIPAAIEALQEAGRQLKANIPGLLAQISPEMGQLATDFFAFIPGAFETLKEDITFAFGVVKTIWDNTVKPVFDALVGYINDTMIPAIQKIWTTYVEPLKNNIKKFWNENLKPIFEKVGTWLGENLPGILENVMPIILGAAGAFLALKGAMNIAFIVKKVITAISGLGGILSFIAANPIVAVVAAIGGLIGYLIHLYNSNEDFRKKVDEVWAAVKETVTTIWENNLKPAFEAIAKFVTETLIPGFQTLWEDVIQPLGVYLGNAFVEAWTAIKDYWEKDMMPKLTALKDMFVDLYNNVLKPVATWLTDVFSLAWEQVQDNLNTLINFLTHAFKGDWKSAWNDIVGLFGRTFGRIVDKVKTPINTVIGFLNDMIEQVQNALNTVINGINSALTISIPSAQIDVFGQTVGFPGWNWSPNIEPINWGRPIPTLAEGGIVKNGGHAVVGEGEYPEYLRVVNGQAVVTPIKGAEKATSDDITINIYQQPGQNPQQLAEIVQRQFVRWERQRKAAMV